jgi:hypothetical protein
LNSLEVDIALTTEHFLTDTPFLLPFLSRPLHQLQNRQSMGVSNEPELPQQAPLAAPSGWQNPFEGSFSFPKIFGF